MMTYTLKREGYESEIFDTYDEAHTAACISAVPFELVEHMTESEAQEYGPQWGSMMTSGDPGYIMYTAIPPERAEHRNEMVEYLRKDCLRWADPEPEDAEQLERMIAYLEALTYAD